MVENIERSKEFYQSLFGLYVIRDFGENVILTEGLVLQERKIWERFIEREVQYGSNNAELYFEENDMDAFLEKLKKSPYEIAFVNEPMEHDWGQRVVRIYDPDHHMIEVGEALDYVARRMLKQGMSVEDTAHKCQMPVDEIQMIADGIQEVMMGE